MRKFRERAIGAFKYILAIFMMYAGVTTALSPTQSVPGSFGFVYSSRISLVIFGIIFFISGSILLYGKIRRSRRWTGKGLLLIYLCFLFATLVNGISLGGNPSVWVYNFFGTIITASLWLRWKFKTEYVDRKHFVDDLIETEQLRRQTRP